MKTLHRYALFALAGTALLAGCSTPVKLDEQQAAPVESRTGTAVGQGNAGAGTAGTSQSQVASVDLTRNANGAASNLPRTVYFDFDSFVVKDDYRNVIESNAKMLASDRKRHIAVEGHTDDRGGREYNLALGQKRAEAVAKSLTLLGANESQIEAVSFGEERPAVPGDDEAARAKNRRAELTPR